jgi:hypothetical protein
MVGRLVAYRGREGFVSRLRAGPDDLFATSALVDEEDPASRAALAEASERGSTGEETSAADAAARSVTIEEDRGSRLSLRTSGAGGFVVVSDTFAPGWRATLDGKPAPLLRADFAFRAVAVPPGEHDVAMEYDPWR